MPDEPLFNFKIIVKSTIDNLNAVGQKFDEVVKKGTETTKKISDGFAKAASGTKKLSAGVVDVDNKMRQLEADALQLKMAIAKSTDPATIRKMKAELIATNAQMKRLKTEASGAAQSVATLGNRASLTSQIFHRLKSVMITVFGAYGMIRLIRGTVETVRDFELGMARVAAITNATASQIDFLSVKARQLGATKLFTPTEITELQVKLAKLGFTIQEIGNSVEPIINLATATGEDLSSAAELAASTIRGFQLEASDTARVVDVMGKAFTSSALDLSRFRESIKYIAPVANKLGWSIEDVSTALGTLADAQIYGSLAGTGLRNILSKAADSSSDLNKALNGNVGSFDDFLIGLQKLKKEGTNLSDVMQLIDRRASSAFIVLLDNVDALVKNREEMNNVNGSIDEMADKVENTLDGAIKQFSASWKAFVATVSKEGGILSDVIRTLASVFRSLAFSMDEALLIEDRVSKFEKQWDSIVVQVKNGSKTSKEAIGSMNKELDLLGKKKNAFEKLYNEGGKDAERFALEIHIIEREIGVLIDRIDEVNKLEIKGDIFNKFQKDAKNAANSSKNQLEKLESVYDTYIGSLKEKIKDVDTQLGIQRNEFLKSQKLTGEEFTKMVNIINNGVSDSIESFNEFTEASSTIGEFLEKENNLKVRAEAYNELIDRMVKYFTQLRTELLKAGDEDAKFQKKVLKLQQQLELERIALIKNDEERELQSAKAKSDYKIAMYKLDLDNYDISEKEKIEIRKLIKQEEKNIAAEIFDIQQKYRGKDIDAARKQYYEIEDVERSYFEAYIEKLKTTGATAAFLKREEIKFEIKLLKHRIDNAYMLGKTSEEIEILTNKVKEYEAAIDNIKWDSGDTGTDEDNPMSWMEDISKYKQLADQIVGVFKYIADAQVENSERMINDLDTRIAEEQRALDQEIDLMTAGYANNVDAKRQEIDELKKQRDRELKERAAALQKQKRIDSIQQTINLVTAATNIIKDMSKYKFVGIALAATLIGSMFALMASTKSKAGGVASYGEGGIVDGKSHKDGGVLIEAEGKEFIVKKKQTQKYRGLLEAINNDTLPKIDVNRIDKIRSDHNTSFNPNITVDNKRWANIEHLLERNLTGKTVEVHDGFRIEKTGNKVRRVKLNLN